MAETKAIRRLGRTACAGITGSGVPGAAAGRNDRIIVVRAGAVGEAGHAPSSGAPADSEERVELVDRVILVRARRDVPES
ncbi:hypothetical protein FraQA3DRAFT_2816 [Frankia sp. QA3]|nr:hypothetical protein FraQA3DRAFT_2816 [Frankia sp. QA3]